MANILTTLTNGVSYGYKHVVTAQDATDTFVLIDFQANVDLAAIVQVQDSAGINVPLADAVITYPANGQVKIENGAATFTLVADQVINVVAQADPKQWQS